MPETRADPEKLGVSGCAPGAPARYRAMLPPADRRTLLGRTRNPRRPLSWLRPSVLWASRNHVAAHVIDDPSNRIRGEWMHALAARGDRDPGLRIDKTDLTAPRFLLVGDTGEGDGSQYVTVPAIEDRSDATDFMIVCSDVIYPAGDVNEYLEKFHFPYRNYRKKIYAIPGNHDWYDSLHGFMHHFCGAAALPEKRVYAGMSLAERLAWRPASIPDPARMAAAAAMRPDPDPRPQPGPYWVIDTGPVEIVGIDTGIVGSIDAEQGRWLLDVSRRIDPALGHPKPKILVTGRPLVVDGHLDPCPIVAPVEDGGSRWETVDQVVADPAHNYVAAIGGDIHNYQHYVGRPNGRTIDYVVSGGGGAFMHATHVIGEIKPAEIHGATEDEMRLFPIRALSLWAYSRLLSKRLGLGRSFELSPEDASAIVAHHLHRPAMIPGGRRRVGGRLKAAVLRLVGGRLFQRFVSEALDWNDPDPVLFKSMLEIEADDAHLRIRCLAATGCAEHEDDPPVVDDFTIRFDAPDRRPASA
jgi:Calcineurin-like phosphoesterase